jgi:hypothetical protein
MNQKYRLVAVLSIVTFVQGCEFMTVADALSALNSIPASSSSSGSSSSLAVFKFPCEPLENTSNLTTPASSSDATDVQQGSASVQGTYISEITGESVRAVSLHRRPVISITQYGNKIEGIFETDYVGRYGGPVKGEIEGTIIGKTITFDWYSTSNHGTGEWQVESGSNDLTGTWQRKGGYTGSGNWNLVKCQVTENRTE